MSELKNEWTFEVTEAYTKTYGFLDPISQSDAIKRVEAVDFDDIKNVKFKHTNVLIYRDMFELAPEVGG